ncbi:uncharacterized protein LOC131026029 [Salvia miltiorrhiza]|uniref:uncharacterized protein LOC131026029 n=1 Tax=Salvia miltiorrhiza TaxID=226208 RepID=UPI0025ABFBCD|nr:uncharacterized protein LOC131026029 [Salvia miltiorrhiza]
MNLAPFVEHCNCVRHVYYNWKKNFKGPTLKNIFWKAVRSTYQEEWNATVEEMKLEDPAAYNDFMEKDYTRFCKSRSKYIINMLEDIRVALRKKQYKKLQLVEGLGGKFEVQIFDDRFIIVCLGTKTCSCRLWDITGICCAHVMSAIHFMKEDPTVYVHECYSFDKYLKAYGYGLELINGEKMWPKGVGNSVQPSVVRTMPGRPKMKRKRGRQFLRREHRLGGALVYCNVKGRATYTSLLELEQHSFHRDKEVGEEEEGLELEEQEVLV